MFHFALLGDDDQRIAAAIAPIAGAFGTAYWWSLVIVLIALIPAWLMGRHMPRGA